MKIRVLKEECTACGDCVEVCPIAAVELQDDVAVILDNCNFCGLCVTACPVEAIEMTREEETGGDDRDAYKGVWIFAEQRRGKLSGVAAELLGKGRELADRRGGELTALLFGHERELFFNEPFPNSIRQVAATNHRNSVILKELRTDTGAEGAGGERIFCRRLQLLNGGFAPLSPHCPAP